MREEIKKSKERQDTHLKCSKKEARNVCCTRLAFKTGVMRDSNKSSIGEWVSNETTYFEYVGEEKHLRFCQNQNKKKEKVIFSKPNEDPNVKEKQNNHQSNVPAAILVII